MKTGMKTGMKTSNTEMMMDDVAEEVAASPMGSMMDVDFAETRFPKKEVLAVLVPDERSVKLAAFEDLNSMVFFPCLWPQLLCLGPFYLRDAKEQIALGSNTLHVVMREGLGTIIRGDNPRNSRISFTPWTSVLSVGVLKKTFGLSGSCQVLYINSIPNARAKAEYQEWFVQEPNSCLLVVQEAFRDFSRQGSSSFVGTLTRGATDRDVQRRVYVALESSRRQTEVVMLEKDSTMETIYGSLEEALGVSLTSTALLFTMLGTKRVPLRSVTQLWNLDPSETVLVALSS